MRKVFSLLLIFFSFGFCDTALLLHKGWQLIGSSSDIDDMSIFDKKDVEQVWHFDASSQKWRGYSPSKDIQDKISQKGYKKINSLKSWHGFWIKSKKDWALHIENKNKYGDANITLKKGWNLISLPIDSVVSPHIFDDATLWKYSKNDGWEFFQKGEKSSFPTISHITNSDGIWVRSDKDQNISVSSNSSKLHNFNTLDELKEYIKDMALTNIRPICGYYTLPVVQYSAEGGMSAEDSGVASVKTSTPQDATNSSNTNNQEKGVDESDIIKHDSKYIYYISSDNKNFLRHFVNITTFENIVNNNLKPIKTIPIDGYINSIYLVDNRLIVLSNYGTQNQKAYRVDGSVDDEYKDSPAIVVDIFDVTDINDIQRLSSYKINGSINSSRVIGTQLFLITTFNPYIQYTYPYKIYVDAPECKEYFEPKGGISKPIEESKTTKSEQIVANDYKKYAKCYCLQKDKDGRFYRIDYDRPKIEKEILLPYVQKDKQKRKPLISPESFYAPDKKDQEPTITTVSRFDIDSGDLKKSSSVLGYAHTIYASKNAIYLVSNKYPLYVNFSDYKQRSVIYKFLLNSDLNFKSSGFVNGFLLNQFALSEYKDILRVATTQGFSWQNNTKNSIFTLKDIDNSLVVDGVLSGLGKKSEMIRSVRFLGDRAFIVTFKQSDPFYTIDLSDPSNPKKVGELQVYGYSSYLHPIDKDLILGIGRDATPDGQVTGLKMELFDVSNFSNPISLDSYSFGSRFSYSQMEHNHKSLAYRDSDKVFAFSYISGANWNSRIEELGVYQILNDKIEVYKPLKNPDSSQYYLPFQRGLIFDFEGKTYVAYFANGKISYELLDNLKENR